MLRKFAQPLKLSYCLILIKRPYTHKLSGTSRSQKSKSKLQPDAGLLELGGRGGGERQSKIKEFLGFWCKAKNLILLNLGYLMQ